MKTWVRKTLSVGVLAAGALLFGPAAAHADSHQINGGNTGILNGTQLVTGVQVPVNVVGNSAGILGEARSFGAGVNRIQESSHVDQINGHNTGIANGSQVYLPITVPLNIAGNSAAVAGQAGSVAQAVNDVHGGQTESAHTNGGGWWGGGDDVYQVNGGNTGIANGTQIYSPINVPINACGNSIALLGGAWSQGLCANEIRGESGHATESVWQGNGGNTGILNGTQLYAPINMPVNLSGNSIAALGSANSRAISGNQIESAQDGWGNQTTQINGHNTGILNGTQIVAPINAPINVCGNSLGILGSASSAAACANNIFGGNDNFRGGDDFRDLGDDGFWIDDQGHCHQGGHGVFDGDNGHQGGHKGHKPGHGQNAGDAGDQGQYAGDNGTAPDKNDTTGYGSGNAPATNAGYGADKGTEPTTAGYKGNKDDNTKYGDKDTRGKSKSTEASPVANVTDTVGGMGDNSGLGALGILSTLR
jgi:hypothetical protein